MIRTHNFASGEKLNIVAHSHGGNVAIEALNELNKTENSKCPPIVNNLILLGTPSRADYRLNNTNNIQRFINISSFHDAVQTEGDDDTNDLFAPRAFRNRPEKGAENYLFYGKVGSGTNAISLGLEKSARQNGAIFIPSKPVGHSDLHSSSFYDIIRPYILN